MPALSQWDAVMPPRPYPVTTWQAVDESEWRNGWVVLDPYWMARPLRHYCSSPAVAIRFAAWKRRRWRRSIFGRPT